MIEGRFKHGTQHGSGGILNELNTRADFNYLQATDKGFILNKKQGWSSSSSFLLLLIKPEAIDIP